LQSRQQPGGQSYTYLDKHDAVALAVVRGEYDAGALKPQSQKVRAHGIKSCRDAAMPPLAWCQPATMSHPPCSLARSLIALDPSPPTRRSATWGDNIRFRRLQLGQDYDVSASSRQQRHSTANKER
jgi:phosphonate transport system substrate-binding protein